MLVICLLALGYITFTEIRLYQLGTLAKAQTEEIRTKRLVVVDEDGKERAVLGFMSNDDENYVIRMELNDGKGETRVRLVACNDFSSLDLLDKNKEAQVLLKAGGYPSSIELRDGRATASMDAEGLAIGDGNGQLRATLGTKYKDITTLRLWDENGNQFYSTPIK